MYLSTTKARMAALNELNAIRNHVMQMEVASQHRL